MSLPCPSVLCGGSLDDVTSGFAKVRGFQLESYVLSWCQGRVVGSSRVGVEPNVPPAVGCDEHVKLTEDLESVTTVLSLGGVSKNSITAETPEEQSVAGSLRDDI